MYAIEVANKLLVKYGTNDPFSICERMNVSIQYHDIGKIRGYYTKNRRQKFIILSTNIEYSQRKIVLAHELGHAVMHPDLSTPFYTEHTMLSKDKYEVQANQFAAHIILASYDISELEGLGIEQISMITGMPVRYFEYKMH